MKILYKSKQVCVFQSALFQTNSTVINTDDCTLVVDPNWLPEEIEKIKKHVEKCGNKPMYLMFTHSDYDHIIGYNAFPNATGVIASKAFVENPEKEKNLEQIRAFDDDYYIKRDYKIEYPIVTHVIEYDGQVINIGKTQLHFYLAAGHNPDGIFTIVNGVWIAGDYLCAIEFPYIYFSSLAYTHTINKTETILQRHAINLMVCGHGEIITPKKSKKDFAAEVLKRKEDALDYILKLRASIKNSNQPEYFFDFEKFVQRYDFPKIMKRFHEKNVELIKGEIKEMRDKS